MIKDLSVYFKPEVVIYLDSISYNRVERNSKEDGKKAAISYRDRISANATNEGVRLVVARTVIFDPEELFTLDVSFGAELRFNENKAKIDWKSVNLAEEFRMNGRFITSQLLSRIVLLIGHITSSFGQPPIILPALFPPENQ